MIGAAGQDVLICFPYYSDLDGWAACICIDRAIYQAVATYMFGYGK